MTKRSPKLPIGSRLFLVSLGAESVVTLTDADRAGRLHGHGIVLEQRLEAGDTVNLFIDTPHDLLGFADLAAVGLMKPTCLPLELILVANNRIHARLRTDPIATRLATTVLDALRRDTPPALTRARASANTKPTP